VADKASGPVRVAIAGLGRAGWGVQVPALEALSEQYRVVSVYDPNPERQADARTRLGCRTHADFADALAVFQWPADGAVSSVFGRRRSGWHRGIDIRAAHGEPIQASAAGVVVVSGMEPRYGRVLKIEHEYGFTTVYAHNDENLVKVGDWVTPGQRIARVGRTGRATDYHVHFEIRRDGRVYNPLYMLPMPGRAVAHVEETGEESDE